MMDETKETKLLESNVDCIKKLDKKLKKEQDKTDWTNKRTELNLY